MVRQYMLIILGMSIIMDMEAKTQVKDSNTDILVITLATEFIMDMEVLIVNEKILTISRVLVVRIFICASS